MYMHVVFMLRIKTHMTLIWWFCSYAIFCRSFPTRKVTQ